MNPACKPEYYESIYEKSSRNRILLTAKTLFASLGYDNTSTAAIARNAGTSESQLMKHFGGKAGLLEAIFNEGWDRVNAQLKTCFQSASDFDARLSCIPGVVFQNLDEDLDMKALVLLEAHRMREGARQTPAGSGYARFIGLIDGAVERAVADGEFRREMPPLALRSALVGIIEGGIREQVLAARVHFPANYDSGEYRRLFRLFVGTLANGASRGHCSHAGR